MGSNEEYLDKLLQSVSNESKPVVHDGKEYSEDMTDDELLASLIDMYSDELAEFKTEEIIHKEEIIPEEWKEETVAEEMPVSEMMTEAAEDFVEETVVEPIEEVAEEPIISEETVPTNTFITDNNEKLSQDDIAALLSSLQQADDGIDESVETTTSFTEEVVQESVVEEPEMSEKPQVLDISELDKLLGEKTDDFAGTEEDNLLKEMGIESMSAEQIDELLSAASAAENPQPEETVADATQEMDLNDLFGGLNFADDFDPEHNTSADMADLLGGMLGGNNDDLAEIGDLLKKADSNEPVDDSNLRNLLDMDDDIGGNDLLNELLQSGNSSTGEESVAEEKPKKEKKKKEKKEKKEKQPKQPKQPKEKKEGNSLWKKITSILFEEDESLDDEKPVKIAGGDGQINLVDVDENEDILAELMNEDMMAGKKSKKKKDKAKPSKNKKANADSEDGEEVIDPKEQARLEKKKQKAEKAAAKKKAKEEKAEADRAFLKAQPSISTKRAMVAFAFALSIMAIILVIYAFVPAAIEKANARKAFYNKDYYEAYELLHGKELNDSDTILLNKVVCILKMQRKLDSYNNYVKMDKELEALNSLVEAVGLYGESYTYAKALSIDGEYNAIYDDILIILNGKYDVSEETAKEILACESDAEYTLRLQYLVEGKTWGSPETEDGEKPMEDVLPEEEEFLEGQ